jgi:hypothetical protein
MRTKVVGPRVVLLDENSVGSAVPMTSPSLVGPAETERKVRGCAVENLLERSLQQASASEPIVPIAESC